MAKLTRSLAAGAVAALGLGAVGAVAAPATAGDGHHDGSRGGLSLTRTAAETLDKYDVDVKASRYSGDRDARHRGSNRLGNVFFDGAGDNNTTWSRIRINDRTNRVTAVVNGGERRAVLKFRDVRGDDRYRYGGHHRTVLRLTTAGANSLDAAAGADAFDRGDAFAKAGRC